MEIRFFKNALQLGHIFFLFFLNTGRREMKPKDDEVVYQTIPENFRTKKGDGKNDTRVEL